MKKFTQGFTAGIAAATGAVVGIGLALKKSVVDPIENEATKLDENRKKVARKSRSAHKG